MGFNVAVQIEHETKNLFFVNNLWKLANRKRVVQDVLFQEFVFITDGISRSYQIEVVHGVSHDIAKIRAVFCFRSAIVSHPKGWGVYEL